MGHLSWWAARDILSRHEVPVPTFVETGTAVGISLFPICAAHIFKRCHSIELSEYYYRRALANMQAAEWAKGEAIPSLHHGDSAIVVAELARTIDEPVFWWLDAHWYDADRTATESPCPLMTELAVIAARPHADIVVIDDAQCFGRKWSDGPGGDWSDITEAAIRAALGEGRIREHYFTESKYVVRMGPA